MESQTIPAMFKYMGEMDENQKKAMLLVLLEAASISSKESEKSQDKHREAARKVVHEILGIAPELLPPGVEIELTKLKEALVSGTREKSTADVDGKGGKKRPAVEELEGVAKRPSNQASTGANSAYAGITYTYGLNWLAHYEYPPGTCPGYPTHLRYPLGLNRKLYDYTLANPSSRRLEAAATLEEIKAQRIKEMKDWLKVCRETPKEKRDPNLHDYFMKVLPRVIDQLENNFEQAAKGLGKTIGDIAGW